jgi:hypothetical protein
MDALQLESMETTGNWMQVTEYLKLGGNVVSR